MQINKAFTLIELLVVVTIIVVLLALLMPAMDKAIYQAQLTQCAAQQRSVGSAIQLYVFDHKRWYPERGIIGRDGGLMTPILLANHVPDNDGKRYDFRPVIKDYVKINRQLNDPFLIPVNLELDQTVADSIISASYSMYFGWTHMHSQRGGPGMRKVGDRWTYAGRKYSLLLNDYELLWNPDNISGSHPDIGGGKEPILWNNSADHVLVPVYLGYAVQSNWAGKRNRGWLDMNYTHDDGSVRRLTQLKVNDPRTEPTSFYHNNRDADTFNLYVPRE